MSTLALLVAVSSPAFAQERREPLTIPRWVPARGAASAPVTIVTWSDSQCASSSHLQLTFARLEQDDPGQLRFLTRHLPLTTHQNARVLALRAMAAHELGRFWDFHDGVFGCCSNETLQGGEALARALHLDGRALARAPRQARLQEQLAADMPEAARLGITQTPVSYVNGLRLVGDAPLERWKRLIERELTRAARDAGAPRPEPARARPPDTGATASCAGPESRATTKITPDSAPRRPAGRSGPRARPARLMHPQRRGGEHGARRRHRRDGSRGQRARARADQPGPPGARRPPTG